MRTHAKTSGGVQSLDTYDAKKSVRVATAAVLPACTYANAAGTLTGDANGALAAVDGVTLVAGEDLLVKDQAAGAQNGIYRVTVLGTAGTAFVLTRRTDSDVSAEVTAGMYVYASEGTANGNTWWTLTTDDAITLGTTALVFTSTFGPGLAGAGLTYTAGVLAVGAGTGITVNADDVAVNQATAFAWTGAHTWGTSTTPIAITQGAASSGSPTGFAFTGGAHTALAASTEAISVNCNLAQTVEFATGALTTQRAYVVQGPTYGFVGASTLTTATTFAVTAAPAAGTNATLTNSFALQAGGTVDLGATSAGLIYAAVDVPAHTVTVTGSTQVTSVGPSGVRIGQVTVTDASAVTINSAASLYIAGAPVAAGSVTITNKYALWVDAGECRFDENVSFGGVVDPTQSIHVTGSVGVSGQFISAFNNQACLVLNGGSAAGCIVGAGTVGAPTYTTTGDTNTGGYFPAADQYAITAGGSQIINCAFVSSTARLGFFAATPVVQPSAYTQTYATADKTHAAFTSADLATTATTQTTPFGFASQAQGDNIATQFNLLRADMTDLKNLVNSVIDDLQALGLAA